MSKSVESISESFDISTKNPILLVPYIAPIIIQIIFNVLAHLFPIRYYYGPSLVAEVPNTGLIILGSFIAGIVGFIAACTLVDMTNDVINGRPVNLSKSLSYVRGRISILIVLAIIAAIFSITIILLPIAMFLVVVAIIEGKNVAESIKKTFSFVSRNLGEVVVFIIIVIIVGIIFSYGFSLIPVVGLYIGNIIGWIINAIFTISAVHLYISLEQLPPPPPPPPPP
ncbi:MAG: hypothetical protein QXK73_06415 [Candidatus Bathyarchaeia archaeon]